MRLLKSLIGFTLMELMVTIVIVGILAAIAYPAYVDQMRKTRRSDAQSALLNMAAHMEHYFTENNTYLGATADSIGVSSTSPEGYYDMSITNLTATSYTLNAAPVATGPQASDTCGTLTLTNTNLKGPNIDCW